MLEYSKTLLRRLRRHRAKQVVRNRIEMCYDPHVIALFAEHYGVTEPSPRVLCEFYDGLVETLAPYIAERDGNGARRHVRAKLDEMLARQPLLTESE